LDDGMFVPGHSPYPIQQKGDEPAPRGTVCRPSKQVRDAQPFIDGKIVLLQDGWVWSRALRLKPNERPLQEPEVVPV
jgi:hypothetical protein